MKATIAKGASGGIVAAPPSKSYTIRALFAAALAEGESRISNPLISDDTEAAAEVLTQLGTKIERNPGHWSISGGLLKPLHEKLNCRQSAATLRFLAPVCAMLEGTSRISFAPGLALRPMSPLLDVFSQMGVPSELTDNHLNISGTGGRLKTNTVTLPGNISSQFISGLLFAAPLVKRGLSINLITPAESKDYLKMTLSCLSHFGIGVEANQELSEFRVAQQSYKPTDYNIEGDWSSASYFLGLGAIAGKVTVTGLNENSFQADKFVLNCLGRMDARVNVEKDAIIVSPSPLQPLQAGLNEAIDLLPTVACLAAVAGGRSSLIGIERARLKESDRVAVVAKNLKRMGVEIIEEPDRLTIGGGYPRGAIIDSFGDHRIAMAFATLATVCGDTVITGADCVNKTYPGFWEDFKRAGGKVTLSE
ncbi:3-phosphoshikimate 1-carboxyvinyltransferase [Dehalogenimonas etheniformans]|uniref:3-phosphoshikimate 1-carboxyvinyltransferase n=1 Tax=Dehalogenimonas etheniformans TaxID=1536648 RepID=A0A2P5P7H9_9CHLR|nr:3-phosphoshikimate 1-carboxyvinyltransferase [Dehalogenimonas etheniformans]PPD58240.1 3-phosphoshikimate 1-carboxyvinyltransferase [Dehalogenimonas etheniformans]QNT75649.1 3-phosphoshikimate 1-carboxyvinyltransferase [Dehalogenimonas etheniformans]